MNGIYKNEYIEWINVRGEQLRQQQERETVEQMQRELDIAKLIQWAKMNQDMKEKGRDWDT